MLPIYHAPPFTQKTLFRIIFFGSVTSCSSETESSPHFIDVQAGSIAFSVASGYRQCLTMHSVFYWMAAMLLYMYVQA
jgi:hypothetical protein